jgi:uncharacterized membrane protein
MFIAGVVVGAAIGWRASLVLYREVIQDLLVKAGVDNKDLLKIKQAAEADNSSADVAIKVESHSGHLYAYRKDNDEFLAQGADKDSLLAAIKDLPIEGRVVITEEDGAELVR